jgi:hypothetical protein
MLSPLLPALPAHLVAMTAAARERVADNIPRPDYPST